MKNYKLTSAILQLVCALALVGISIYYLVVQHYVNFALFLVIALIFIGLSIRAIYKWWKAKKDEDNDN